jgi:glutathione peroxidase
MIKIVMQRRTILNLLPAVFSLPWTLPLLLPSTLLRAGSARADNAAPSDSIFGFTVKLLDGTTQQLAAYRGKVVLVVNTASQCRYTPQYEGLEKLYQEYRGRGLVILGFPSNDFRGKEPGNAAEIGSFCRTRYGVTFPMFDKVQVIEPDACPLYRFLSTKSGPPKWNFHKYLVSKDGQVIQAFQSEITPDNPLLKSAIEAALQSPHPAEAAKDSQNAAR